MAELVSEVEESVVDDFSFDLYTGILSWVENHELVTLRTLAATIDVAILKARVIVPWSQRLSFILYWQILRRESLLIFLPARRFDQIANSRRKFPK